MGNQQSSSGSSASQQNKPKSSGYNFGFSRFLPPASKAPAPTTTAKTDLKVPIISPETNNNIYQLKYKSNLPINYAIGSSISHNLIGVDTVQSIALAKGKPDIDLDAVSNRYKLYLGESERFSNDYKRSFADYQERIRKNSQFRYRERVQESHNLKLEILKQTTDYKFNQHTITRPELSISSTISLKAPLDSYRIHDNKYFPTPREFPELTPEILEQVRLALVPNPPNEVLVEIDGAQITRKDIQTLHGLNWLNDEIINAYMTLLCTRSQRSGFKRSYSFNTFFYPKLVSSGYASVKRWTRRVDLFSNDYIIVPVHLGNHWCLSFIDFTKKTVSYFDSMGGSPNKCCDRLLSYLKDESKDKKKQEFDDENWRSIDRTRQGIPQQTNYSDCGVFACTFAEYLTREAKFNFTQKQMPYFRKKMVYEIINKKILE